MGLLERNLTQAGCLVGSDVYPGKTVENIVTCSVPRLLVEGERVAPVIEKNARFYENYNKTIRLSDGKEVTLKLWEVTPLPQAVRIHVQASAQNLVTIPQKTVVEKQHVDNVDVPLKTKRFQICHMTQVSAFLYLIKDWVSYHRRVGVDHFYIFDNGASEDIHALLGHRSDVEVVKWPYHKSQQQLISYFLFMARTRCESVFFSDIDEYVMMGLGTPSEFAKSKPMPAYMKHVRATGRRNVKMPYILMRNSGFVKRQKRPVPEIYIHRIEQQPFDNGKSLCDTSLEYECGLIHSCGREKGGRLVATLKERGAWHSSWNVSMTQPTKQTDPAYILHFRLRSWEEWVEKAKAGSAHHIDSDTNHIIEADESNSIPVWYLKVSKDWEFTHFRKIYTRVMREGREEGVVLV